MKTAYWNVRIVDSYLDGDCWVWNNSYGVGNFKVSEDASTDDIRKTFLNWLDDCRGFSFDPDSMILEYDGNGDVFEISDKKTGEILMAAGEYL